MFICKKRKLQTTTILIINLMIACVLLLTGCGVDKTSVQATEPTKLIVSAAASLQDVMAEVKLAFQSKHKDIDVQINYGSSGALQKQIEQGSPVDVFISAGTKPMNALVKAGLVEEKMKKALLYNDLVVIVPSSSTAAWSSLDMLKQPEISRIAIGAPESVPAGMYAEQTLKSAGLWDVLNNKYVYTKDVRQVLSYVSTGNAEAGFVYRTDALTTNKAVIAYPVKSDQHEPIIYPIAIIKNSKNATAAQKWFDYMNGAETQHLFKSQGFRTATSSQ
ncbi:molybdate ABC transporter substrate-binding protein [Paenibacillus taiwanensis]|uniref:molybdate ABC transporter substrate-binding protein n=1 Tax=Paenibacillus taiwanensis TaxID=401638 RepID=UPI0004053741|nr:molybdate ABC transporter substrate-binding protein [Paenibacillus taiwanensis]